MHLAGTSSCARSQPGWCCGASPDRDDIARVRTESLRTVMSRAPGVDAGSARAVVHGGWSTRPVELTAEMPGAGVVRYLHPVRSMPRRTEPTGIEPACVGDTDGAPRPRDGPKNKRSTDGNRTG